MTFREKLETEYPDMNIGVIIANNCPCDYAYERETPCCPIDIGQDCSDCWNREIPGSDIEDGVTEEMNQQIIEKSIVTQKSDGNLEFKVEQKTVLGTKGMHINTETFPIAKILDSGNRREFETGAVRDICEGKGRCDLMPLEIVEKLISLYSRNDKLLNESSVIHEIHIFQCSGIVDSLFLALHAFSLIDSVKAKWPDIYTMLLDVAKQFEDGAKKYGEYDWQKGIPTHCYIDSAVRHYLKFLRGDKDEPHDRAFVWNIMCCIWTCANKPELNDYPRKEENKEPNDEL